MTTKDSIPALVVMSCLLIIMFLVAMPWETMKVVFDVIDNMGNLMFFLILLGFLFVLNKIKR